MRPTRWLHVRHPGGFDQRRFEMFRAQCRVFRAYVESALGVWDLVGSGEAPRYEFFEPELSTDGKTATLPIGGEQSFGSRHAFEDWRSYMLWEWFPVAFIEGIEEGVTEMDLAANEFTTSWRRPSLRLPAWAKGTCSPPQAG